jgi:uncharacterized protein YkuJ
MKTTIIRNLLFAGAISLHAFTSQSQSSPAKRTAYSPGNTGIVNAVDDKVDLSGLKDFVTNEKANRKIVQYFSKQVKTIGNISWSKVDDNILAEYAGAKTKNRVLFNKNGNPVYTISYSGENMLPRNYREMMYDMYPGYSIKQVSKVNEGDREIWVVKLDTPARLLTVRIENNQPEEVEKFRKPR